ncbi:hypothetical protein HZS_2454 [Henneguya salminicola]|nr:hypothetical protein HZS_2454 [Henneguya salminicola]
MNFIAINLFSFLFFLNSNAIYSNMEIDEIGSPDEDSSDEEGVVNEDSLEEPDVYESEGEYFEGDDESGNYFNKLKLDAYDDQFSKRNKLERGKPKRKISPLPKLPVIPIGKHAKHVPARVHQPDQNLHSKHHALY